MSEKLRRERKVERRTETSPETTEADLGVDTANGGLGLASLEGSVEPERGRKVSEEGEVNENKKTHLETMVSAGWETTAQKTPAM
jgi:hypothetical protein